MLETTESLSPPDLAAIVIRPLGDTDLDQVMQIEGDSFSTPWPRSAFDLALSTPTILSLAAEIDGVAAGYLIACCYGDTVLIANLAVHSDHRRNGIGRRLLHESFRWAASSGSTRCRLEVRLSNRPAIRLYRTLGFRPVGVQPAYYTQPTEDALTMLRETGGPAV